MSAFPDSNNGACNNEEENDAEFKQLYEKKRYVPVALVLETETEHHDVFR